MDYPQSCMPRPIRIGPRKPVRVYLKARREASGLTQEQLANRLGVTHSTISRWESETEKRRFPSANVLAAIAECLGIHISLLFIDPEHNSVYYRLERLPQSERDLFLAMIDGVLRRHG